METDHTHDNNYDEGRKLFAQGRYDEAAEKFQTVPRSAAE